MQFICIHTNENGTFYKVSEEAKIFLAQLHQPIAVVSAVGPYRGGKSWILNRLANKTSSAKHSVQKQFETSPTVQPQTRGLWITNEPTDNILFMDTEGLNAPKSTLALDINILALALFFSSKVIFSSIGPINSNALDNLQCAIGTAEWLSKEAQVFESKPHLLWLLRDFSLQLKDEAKNPITATQYLEQSLANATELRDALHQLFEVRTCIAMIRPVQRDSDLEHMQHLLPAFERDVQFVQDNVYHSTPMKKFNGRDVTGPVMLAMAESLCAILSKGDKAPKLVSVWENARLAANAEARYKTLEHFNTNLHAHSTPEPKLFFWGMETIEHQLKNALQTWARLSLGARIEDTTSLVEGCLQSAQTSSQVKMTQWIDAMSKANDDSFLHLLPQTLQQALNPWMEQHKKMEQELVLCKQQLEEVSSQLELLHTTQHKSLESALVNEEQLRQTKQELQHKSTELEELLAAHAAFRETAMMQKTQLEQQLHALKQKQDSEGTSVTKLQERIESLTREKETKTNEYVKLETENLENARKRKLCETQTKLLETQLQTKTTEINFLTSTKAQTDAEVAKLRAENSTARMDMFKIQCRLDTMFNTK